MWIKIAVREVTPITLVAFRAVFGVLFGAAVILFQKTQLLRSWKSWSPLLLLGLTNIAVPFFLISWGEQYIDSAVASILDATVPLFTILIAHYLLRDDKITLPKVLGLLTGFAGVVVLMSKDLAHASTSSLLGQAAVILASVFYAIRSAYPRRNTEDTPGILRSAGPLVSASGVMWLATFLFESPVKMLHLGITWIALLWLGVLGSGLAFLMAYYLIHEIGPTRLTMVTYLFPLGGVTLGVTFLHEQLTWQVIMGGVLILASLAIANREPKKREVHERRQVTSS